MPEYFRWWDKFSQRLQDTHNLILHACTYAFVGKIFGRTTKTATRVVLLFPPRP